MYTKQPHLSEKNKQFEKNCKQIFVGQTIQAVVYGELKYFQDENGNNINPKPCYKTKYPDLHTLDFSIYFITNNNTIWVTWGHEFTCYGLQAYQCDHSVELHDHEQHWNVSNNSNWTDIIGKKIIDFEVFWDETWYSNSGWKKNLQYSPQIFRIEIENDKSIYIASAELSGEEEEYIGLMDNLLVSTNFESLENSYNKKQKKSKDNNFLKFLRMLFKSKSK